MERVKPSDLFQDLWCFLKKWFVVILSVVFVSYGISSLFTAFDFYDSADIASATLFASDGWGQIIVGLLLFIIDFLQSRLPVVSSSEVFEK